MSGFPIEDNVPLPMEDIDCDMDEEDQNQNSDSEHIPPIDSAALLEGDVESAHQAADAALPKAAHDAFLKAFQKHFPPQPETPSQKAARIFARTRKVPRLAGSASSSNLTFKIPLISDILQQILSLSSKDEPEIRRAVINQAHPRKVRKLSGATDGSTVPASGFSLDGPLFPAPRQLLLDSSNNEPASRVSFDAPLFPALQQPLPDSSNNEPSSSSSSSQPLEISKSLDSLQTLNVFQSGFNSFKPPESFDDFPVSMEPELTAELPNDKGKVKEVEGPEGTVAEQEAPWKGMDEQLVDKVKKLQIREPILDQKRERLEGLQKDSTKVSTGEAVAQAQGEIDRLSLDGTACLEDLRRQLSDREGELGRVRAEMRSSEDSFKKELTDMDKANRLLSVELTNNRDAARAEIKKTKHELKCLHRKEMGERRISLLGDKHLRDEHLPNQHNSSGIMDNDVSELAGSISTLHLQHAESVHSANERLRQALQDQQSANEQLRRDLALEKGTTEALRQSLTECQEQKTLQHERELGEQAERIVQADALLANASAKALDEERRLHGVISGLKKDLEASRAKLEGQEKAFRETKGRIHYIQDLEKDHVEKISGLYQDNLALGAKLSLSAKDCEYWRTRAKTSKSSQRQAQRNEEAAIEEMAEAIQAKEAAEAETRSLHAVNRELNEEKSRLGIKAYCAILRLDDTAAELRRYQTRSIDLVVELRRVGVRLAECESTMKKEADGVRELEELVDGRLAAWERWEEAHREDEAVPEVAAEVAAVAVEEGKKEMDALLGEPEEAKEGFPRPLFPSWKQLLFWLLVSVWLSVVVFSYASATNRKRQMWEEMARRAALPLHGADGPEFLWQDPRMDLSGGMYRG
ncbi:hypothetical protein MMC29_008083 [Sticta canariensis]|nr:hypothetical protein [Sticta canariensis]